MSYRSDADKGSLGMSSQRLLTETAPSGVVTLTLNRPEVHNAFDDELIAELTAEFRRLEGADGIRAVVLAANGKSFSAGGDLGWMRRMADYSQEENFKDAFRLSEMLRSLDRLSAPTIAKVQGAAFGGGVGLAACCDIAIASEDAFFCFSEARLGLIPAAISPFVMAAIGARPARRYFLTAERFTAVEAHRLGLVHVVVSPEDLDEAVERITGELLQSGPAASRAAKDLIGAVSGRPIDRATLEDTASRLAAARAGDEARERIEAFLEKRKPSP